MTLAVSVLALAVFLSGAVSGVLVMLVIGIRRGDRAHHLAAEPDTHVDALTRRMLGVGVRTGCPQAMTTPKEHDQCMLLTGLIAPRQ
jgi:hypothetical protein